MNVRVFLLEPQDQLRLSLRRYTSSSEKKNPCPLVSGDYSYHTTMVHLTDLDFKVPEDGNVAAWDLLDQHRPPPEDSRWPRTCPCGFQFKDTDVFQLFQESLYQKQGTGEILTLRNAPVGALWYATWYKMSSGKYGWDWDNMTEPPLVCKTPGGEWIIDGRASNCDKKEDRLHRCWIRHGVPPDVHVDKNGPTCGAGAGSIQAGSYHGFLHNGYLTDCPGP